MVRLLPIRSSTVRRTTSRSESWPYGKWENDSWSASYNDTKNHFKISSQSADDDEGF